MSKRQTPTRQHHEALILPSLAGLRKAKVGDQGTMSRRSGVSEGMIANLETGRKHPSRETLNALAVTLDEPVERIGLFLPDGFEYAELLRELLVELVAYTRAEVLASKGAVA